MILTLSCDEVHGYPHYLPLSLVFGFCSVGWFRRVKGSSVKDAWSFGESWFPWPGCCSLPQFLLDWAMPGPEGLRSAQHDGPALGDSELLMRQGPDPPR